MTDWQQKENLLKNNLAENFLARNLAESLLVNNLAENFLLKNLAENFFSWKHKIPINNFKKKSFKNPESYLTSLFIPQNFH